MEKILNQNQFSQPLFFYESSWEFVGVYTDEDEDFLYEKQKYTSEENPAIQEMISIEQMKRFDKDEKVWLASIHMSCQISIWEVHMPRIPSKVTNQSLVK